MKTAGVVKDEDTFELLEDIQGVIFKYQVCLLPYTLVCANNRQQMVRQRTIEGQALRQIVSALVHK